MDGTETNSIAEWAKLIASGGAGTLVLAFLARFTLRKMVEESAAQERAGGELDIIAQLRAEVDRLADINAKLSAKVADLQTQIFELREENAKLKIEIGGLKR